MHTFIIRYKHPEPPDLTLLSASLHVVLASLKKNATGEVEKTAEGYFTVECQVDADPKNVEDMIKVSEFSVVSGSVGATRSPSKSTPKPVAPPSGSEPPSWITRQPRLEQSWVQP